MFNTLFLNPDFVNTGFPPGGTIHTEDIDGKAVTAVVKDTVRIDLQAIEAFQKADFKTADSLFAMYLNTVGNNIGISGMISFTKAALNQFDDAIRYGNMSVEIDRRDFYGYLGLGLAYSNNLEFEKAVKNLKIAKALRPENPDVDIILKNTYKNMETYTKKNNSKNTP